MSAKNKITALVSWATLTSITAWAQTPPDAGRLLEETRPPLRPTLPSQTAPKVIEAPVRPTINMPEGVAVTAAGFRITGAQSYPESVLTELVKPWVGKKLDIAGLNEAAGAITRYYQSAGHLLTYAYLPAQRVADGVIEIAVLEGRLEGVQIVTAQDVRLRDEVIQAHTEGLSDKPPLLQADVERKLLLLSDIPGVVARAAFTPGSTTGAAEMVVSVAEDEPLDFRAEINNHGARSTGQFRMGLTLQLRDLFGWGDSTRGTLLVSNKGSLVSGSLASSVPLGGDGWRMGASASHLSYQLAGVFRRAGATGSADTAGLDFGYALIRSTDTNVALKTGFEYKWLRDDLQVPGTSNPKRNGVFELGASFDRRDGLGGLSAGNATVSTGRLRLLDEQHRSDDIAGLRTAREWRKLYAQVARQQALSGPYSLYLRLAGQTTGANLDSSEKLGLAGPGTVRAYAPGEASVDQGGFGSLELRYSMDYLGGNLVGALFHDRAAGRINRQPLPSVSDNAVTLSGTGLSVQWNGGDYGLSASVAWRGSRLPTAEGGDPRPRVYLQLSVTP